MQMGAHIYLELASVKPNQYKSKVSDTSAWPKRTIISPNLLKNRQQRYSGFCLELADSFSDTTCIISICEQQPTECKFKLEKAH